MNKKKSMSTFEAKSAHQNSQKSLLKPTESQAAKIKSGILSAGKPTDKENTLCNRTVRKNLPETGTTLNKNLGLKKVKERAQRQRVASNMSMTPLRKVGNVNQQNNQSSSNSGYPRSSAKKMEKTGFLPNSSRRNSSKKLIKSLNYDEDAQKEQEINHNASLYQIKPIEELAVKLLDVKVNESKKLAISCFQIICKICQTPFSGQFKVMHIRTGFLYCLRVIPKDVIHSQGLQQQILSQIRFRMKYRHPNMQKLFTVFDDEVNLYLLEEYVLGLGDLEKDLKKYRRLGEQQCGIIAKQIVDFYQFIQSESYIHRSLALSSLALAYGIIKIVDFSWITELKMKRERDTFCGSYKQAPPQLLEGNYYDESIDIWCLGTLLYEISTGIVLFENGKASRDIQCLNFPISMSVELVNLLGGLLANKQCRISLEEVMNHEWIRAVETDGLIGKEIWAFWTGRI